MKKLSILLSLLLIFIMLGCKGGVIESEGFPLPEDGTTLLDFSYRESTNYAGFVQFVIHANNIKQYEWSFGFLDEKGQLVTSNSSAPGIFFPANGHYSITLKGIDKEDHATSVNKIIEVSNFQ